MESPYSPHSGPNVAVQIKSAHVMHQRQFKVLLRPWPCVYTIHRSHPFSGRFLPNLAVFRQPGFFCRVFCATADVNLEMMDVLPAVKTFPRNFLHWLHLLSTEYFPPLKIYAYWHWALLFLKLEIKNGSLAKNILMVWCIEMKLQGY